MAHRFVSLLVLSIFVFVGICAGQEISGTVKDPSGAVVPWAVVRITNRDTGATISLTTERQGQFKAVAIGAGSYDLTVESPGFSAYSLDNVVLKAGDRREVNVALSLATVNEQTTVTAKAPIGEGALETSASNAVEILEVREVRESAAKDIGEALASVDGVWKVRKGPIANDVVVRGFQRGNIDVLLDGMRVYEACPSQMDPAAYHMDFAELDSVDVIKGPYDYRYEGSLGGTVKVIGKEPGESLTIIPSLTTGAFGFYNPSFVASDSIGPMHVLAGYAYRRSDAYVTGSGKKVTEYANFTPAGIDSKAFESHAGWARAEYDISSHQAIEFLGGYQADGLTLYPGLLMDASYDTTKRLGMNWNLRQMTGVVKSLRGQAYVTTVEQWMDDQLRTSAMNAPRGYSMGTISRTRALGGRLEAELSNLIVGAEVYERGWDVSTTKVKSSAYVTHAAIPNVRMMVGGMYGQYGRSFGKLHLSLSGRLDSASSEARSPDLGYLQNLYWAYHNTRADSASDLNGSGQVQLVYLLPKGIEMFVGFGSSTRLPDPEERYYGNQRMQGDWVGNPLLRSSRNTETDFGINWRRGHFALRPTVFFGRVSDFIATTDQPKLNMVPGVMSTVARSYENVDAQVAGGEVAYAVEIRRSLLLSGGVSYIRGLQFANVAAGIPSGNMAEIPPLKARMALRYGSEWLFAEVNSTVADRQDKINTYVHELATSGYAVFGFKLGVHRKLMNFSVGVDNLGDRFYYEHLSFVRDPDRTGVRVPEPGRAFYVNLSVDLAKLH